MTLTKLKTAMRLVQSSAELVEAAAWASAEIARLRARVDELLGANNDLVEQRRAAEDRARLIEARCGALERELVCLQGGEPPKVAASEP